MKISSCVYESLNTAVKVSTMLTVICAAPRLNAQNVDSNVYEREQINHSLWNPYCKVQSEFTVPYFPNINYTKSDTIVPQITPAGVEACAGIEFPSCEILISGKKHNAVIVVDIKTNTLYTYDANGLPLKAYKVASGKKSTPTKRGIRQISHIEVYPYRSAPKGSKRRGNPKAYGPKLLYLNIVNPSTGEITGSNGQFIHGNNKPSSIGKYCSKGCVRMDNDAILEIADFVKGKDYVLIK